VQITLKLFASLADRLPPGARKNVGQLDVPPGSSVQAVVDGLGIADDQAHLVIVNGVFVPCAQRAGRVLQAGDTVAIWPPVAGG